MNYSCDRDEIPAALHELAEWCEANDDVPDNMVGPARDLLERWSAELFHEIEDPDEDDIGESDKE